jgi:hypothetical protein
MRKTGFLSLLIISGLVVQDVAQSPKASPLKEARSKIFIKCALCVVKSGSKTTIEVNETFLSSGYVLGPSGPLGDEYNVYVHEADGKMAPWTSLGQKRYGGGIPTEESFMGGHGPVRDGGSL